MPIVQQWIVRFGIERSHKVRKPCILAVAGHLHAAICGLELSYCFEHCTRAVNCPRLCAKDLAPRSQFRLQVVCWHSVRPVSASDLTHH